MHQDPKTRQKCKQFDTPQTQQPTYPSTERAQSLRFTLSPAESLNGKSNYLKIKQLKYK